MQSRSAKSRVLLVDDEPHITATLARGLQNHGFATDTFNDPNFALAEFKPNRYDMIILDVKMPGMSGFDLARKFWAVDPNARISFFSAHEIYEQEAKVMFRSLKVVNFLKKPISPSELAAYITNLLQH